MERGEAKRGGFTLVELLVVIGIIAMLISILMPALSSARAQANTIKCAANLRGIGQVMHMYAGDYKGNIPRDYFYDGQYRDGNIFYAEAFARYLNKGYVDRTNGNVGSSRDTALVSELAKIPLYQCPVFPNEQQVVCYVSNGFPIRRGNSGRAEPLINITKIKHGSQFVYLIDGNAGLQTNYFGNHDLWVPGHLPFDPPTSRVVNPNARIITDERHRGMANILAVDASVNGKRWRDIKERDFRIIGS